MKGSVKAVCGRGERKTNPEVPPTTTILLLTSLSLNVAIRRLDNMTFFELYEEIEVFTLGADAEVNYIKSINSIRSRHVLAG